MQLHAHQFLLDPDDVNITLLHRSCRQVLDKVFLRCCHCVAESGLGPDMNSLLCFSKSGTGIDNKLLKVFDVTISNYPVPCVTGSSYNLIVIATDSQSGEHPTLSLSMAV